MNDKGKKIIIFRVQVCYSAVSTVDEGQELVSTVDVCAQRGKHREGLSKLAFAALFSLGYFPSYHSVCCPATISGKATVKTKSCLRGAAISVFYFCHDEKGSP